MKNIANEIKTIRYAFEDGRSTQKSIMRKVKVLTDQFETMDDLIDSLNGYADTHYTWAITYLQLARIIVSFQANNNTTSDKKIYLQSGAIEVNGKLKIRVTVDEFMADLANWEHLGDIKKLAKELA